MYELLLLSGITVSNQGTKAIESPPPCLSAARRMVHPESVPPKWGQSGKKKRGAKKKKMTASLVFHGAVRPSNTITVDISPRSKLAAAAGEIPTS